jgi:hypothetical protein
MWRTSVKKYSNVVEVGINLELNWQNRTPTYSPVLKLKTERNGSFIARPSFHISIVGTMNLIH